RKAGAGDTGSRLLVIDALGVILAVVNVSLRVAVLRRQDAVALVFDVRATVAVIRRKGRGCSHCQADDRRGGNEILAHDFRLSFFKPSTPPDLRRAVTTVRRPEYGGS